MLDSIKDVTRQKRGSGGRFHVTEETPIPRNWKAYLRHSDNKPELFRLIASILLRKTVVPEGKQFYCTLDKSTGYSKYLENNGHLSLLP